MRGHVFGAKWGADKPVTGGLFADQATSGRFIRHRLRMGVKFSYKDLANLNLHIQGFDDGLWGDNADLASAPLFAETPSNTGIDGLERPDFELFRAWMEFRAPVGVLRVGRMSSHWGLGLLANDGDGFRNDFGEAHFGNQFDRVLFGTNPVSIVQAMTKKDEKKEIPLLLVVAVDRLVEDPLTQYYGYRCSPGRTDGVDDDYDARCDTDEDGVTDLDHSWTEGRDAANRSPSWWTDQRDDVWEMVYALLYRGEDIRYLGGIGDLTAGAYVIHRLQSETDSNVVVGDLFLDANVHGAFVQFEGVGIWGRTRALALPDSAADDPLAKRASIYGYVARAGYAQPTWKVMMESGLATGDNQVNDELFTGRSLHPDHNVGLILYEEVLRYVTQELWAGTGRGLRSKGGVYNSHYINPKVYGYPMDKLEVIGGFVMAWPDRPDGAVIRCREQDVETFGCASASATAGPIGWEVDLAAKYRWLDEHMTLTLETGYAHATDRLPLESVRLNPAGNFWTFQSRVSWQF